MQNLIPIEYKDQRVLTTQQIADGYEATTDKIKQNYSNNKSRYIEGIHYFILEGDELRRFKSEVENFDLAPNINKFFLWTEKGALLHAKSLNTDRAWEVYGELVDTYFRAREIRQYNIPQSFSEALRLAADLEEQNQKLITDNTSMKPKAEFFDAVAGSKDAMEMGAVAKIIYEETRLGRNKLFKQLRAKGILMGNNLPYQEYVDRGYFRIVEQSYCTPDGEVKISKKTLVYQKGLNYIRKVLSSKTA